MDYGYELIKEVMETAVYSMMCFQILGLKSKEKKYFWGIMLLAHVLVWSGLWCMKADYMVVVPVCTFLEISLPVMGAEGKFGKRATTVFLSYIVASIANMMVGLSLNFVLDINKENRQFFSILVVLVIMIILCIILSNLLSNAIEAASALADNRRISLHIKQNQDQWYLRVKNTYCVESSNTAFTYSTKSGSQHGYGIKNIREAVDRLGGEVHFGTEGAYVIAEVFLVETQ